MRGGAQRGAPGRWGGWRPRGGLPGGCGGRGASRVRSRLRVADGDHLCVEHHLIHPLDVVKLLGQLQLGVAQHLGEKRGAHAQPRSKGSGRSAPTGTWREGGAGWPAAASSMRARGGRGSPGASPVGGGCSATADEADAPPPSRSSSPARCRWAAPLASAAPPAPPSGACAPSPWQSSLPRPPASPPLQRRRGARSRRTRCPSCAAARRWRARSDRALDPQAP